MFVCCATLALNFPCTVYNFSLKAHSGLKKQSTKLFCMPLPNLDGLFHILSCAYSLGSLCYSDACKVCWDLSSLDSKFP